MSACSPFGAAGEFAASRHGAFTRRQAASIGLTATSILRLIRDQVLAEPVPGVLTVMGSPPTWHQQLKVATLASNEAGVAAFHSAAALHRIDGYASGPIELLVASQRHLAIPGLILHRGPMDARDLIDVDGIRCTTIARTLCDIGSVDSEASLRVAFDWAWRSGVSLRWISDTALRLATNRRPGPRRILQLIEEADRRRRPTESALEVGVEQTLASIPGLLRQFVVTRRDGSFVARVDFAIPELKIAIEAHSRRHHFGPTAEERDAAREAALQGEGWIVRFVTDAQRRRPDELRRSIIALVEARSAARHRV
jgi:very-short-patch-repair endonuclease